VFTSAAKQLFAALGKSSPQDSQGMAGAVANCEQPLSHRGPVNLTPIQRGARDGTFNQNPWSLSNDLPLPNAGAGGADLPSSPSPWNSYNTGFYFPTDQFFTQNQFFGGPTLHVGGPIDASSVNTQIFAGSTANVTNLTVEVINGDPVGGPAGVPGQPGAAGDRGVPGAPGFGGFFGFGRFRELKFLDGKNPRVAVTRDVAAAPHKFARDGWTRPLAGFDLPTNAISGGTVTVVPASVAVSIPSAGTVSITPASASVSIPTAATVSITPASVNVSIPNSMSVAVAPSTVSFSVPTGVTFNPDTCEVSFLGYETITVAGIATMSGSVSINGYATVTVGDDTPVTGSVAFHGYNTVNVAGTASVTGDLVITQYSTATVAATSSVTASVSGSAASTISIHAFSSVATSSFGATTAPTGAAGGVLIRLQERQTRRVTVLTSAQLQDVNRLNADLLHRN
jgi:hypothetical protein